MKNNTNENSPYQELFNLGYKIVPLKDKTQTTFEETIFLLNDKGRKTKYISIGIREEKTFTEIYLINNVGFFSFRIRKVIKKTIKKLLLKDKERNKKGKIIWI